MVMEIYGTRWRNNRKNMEYYSNRYYFYIKIYKRRRREKTSEIINKKIKQQAKLNSRRGKRNPNRKWGGKENKEREDEERNIKQQQRFCSKQRGIHLGLRKYLSSTPGQTCRSGVNLPGFVFIFCWKKTNLRLFIFPPETKREKKKKKFVRTTMNRKVDILTFVEIHSFAFF